VPTSASNVQHISSSIPGEFVFLLNSRSLILTHKTRVNHNVQARPRSSNIVRLACLPLN
jgi:hypothetical protein